MRSLGKSWKVFSFIIIIKLFENVLRNVSAGLVEIWKITYTKDMLKNSIPESRNTKMEHYHAPLSLRLLLSLFLVYAVGNVCATLVFVIESIFHHKRHVDVQRKGSLYKPALVPEVVLNDK